MIMTIKILMQIGTIIFAFLGVYFYVFWRHERIARKKTSYSSSREMMAGRIVSIGIFASAAVIVFGLELFFR